MQHADFYKTKNLGRKLTRKLSRKASRKQSETTAAISKSTGQVPEWSFSSFLASLSLLDILANGFNKDRPSNKTEAQWAKDLSEEQVSQALDQTWPKLRQEMIDQLKQLKQQDTVDARDLNDKFSAAEGSFTFTYGGMEMYHAGLEGLIGLPSPDIIGKMLWEHTQSWYASISFDCWYIPGGTTAAREYSYVDGSATETSCQNGLRDEGHNGWSIQDIMERNMDVIKEAKLQLAEVFALRLYTGPMYLWYNNILRYCRSATGPKWLSHIQLWKEQHATEEHPFVTTLHVINSAILKLSRVQPAEKVFRGNQGGVLPKEFWIPNKDNIRGGIELGFLSTTKDRAVAEKYSTEKQDQPSIVFEIQMGMIDRGASIQFLSQFPAEEEILFAPLTGLEVVGNIQVNGRTLVVQLRLNCNLHDLTIEEITAKMFKTHKDVLHTIKMELQMQGFVQEQLGPMTKHEEFVDSKYKKEGGEWFGNADHYKDVTNRALDAKMQVCSYAMASESSSEASKATAAGVLFKEGDSAALAVAVVTLLQNENLRVEYGGRLSKAAADAAEYSELRLDLKDLGLTGELPDDVISLLLAAERFDISGNQFSNVGAESMQYDMIYKCSCMQKWREGGMLNLSAQNLTDENLAALGSLVSLIVGLVKLNLSGNGITAVGAKSMADGISKCRSLTSIDVSNNAIGGGNAEFAKHIADGIKECKSLKKITFGGDEKKDSRGNGTGEYYEPVTMETTMTEVNVSNRGVGPYAPVIAIFESLVKLKINKCELPIQHIKTATKLDLSNKMIEMLDSIVIAALLPLNKLLVSINLSNNHLTRGKQTRSYYGTPVYGTDMTGVEALGRAIKQSSITSLNIANNELTRGAYHGRNGGGPSHDNNYETDMAGIIALGAAIKDSSLTTITFGDGQSGATLSVDMTETDISGKSIGAGGAVIAAEFMQRMTSLTQITLGGEESGWIKKDQVQGDSHDVGAVVVYRGRECTVTKAPVVRARDSNGDLKLRYPPFTLTADMVEIDLSGCGVGSPEAVLTAAFIKEKCGSLTQLNISSNNFPLDLVQQIRDEHPALTIVE